VEGFFSSLGTTVGPVIPTLIGAVILIVIAYIIARAVRFALKKGLTALKLDERLHTTALETTLSEVGYYLVWLFFLPAILGILGLQGLLVPVQNLVNQLLGFLPNILAAVVIFAVGYFVANIVRKIVTNLLTAAGSEKLAARVGLSTSLGKQGLAGLIGLLLFVLILLPVITAALDALALPAVSTPVSALLNKILSAIPNIIAAAVLLAIAYFIARLVSNLVTELVAGIGFDRIQVILGLAKEPVAGDTKPSRVVGVLVMLAIMLFAATEAARLLGFATMSELIAQFTVLAGQIVFGLIIFAIGLYLANLAAKAITETKMANSGLFSGVAHAAILVLTGSMALRQMGIANDIINLAFALLLGAVAVAMAIAFGFGGRETASEILRNILPANMKKTDDTYTSSPKGLQ
jgi:hypothetical protein